MKITPNTWTDRDVELHWDRVADIYVSENQRVAAAHEQRFWKTMDWLELDAGCKVLNVTSRDCGCWDYILRSCPTAEVTNAEISGRLIDVARRLRPGASQTKIETYSQLPFADSVFDRIVSLETLEHCAEPACFLSELFRVAKSNAVLVLSCPPATSEWPYRLYSAMFGGHGEGPHRFLASGEVKALLAESGWDLRRHQGTLLLPVGPRFLCDAAERLLGRYQGTFLAELGIRQFYVAVKR